MIDKYIYIYGWDFVPNIWPLFEMKEGKHKNELSMISFWNISAL